MQKVNCEMMQTSRYVAIFHNIITLKASSKKTDFLWTSILLKQNFLAQLCNVQYDGLAGVIRQYCRMNISDAHFPNFSSDSPWCEASSA